MTVGVRSERLTVTPPREDTSAESTNAVPAELVKSAYVGARWEYELLAAGQRVLAESDAEVTDTQVWLVVPEDGAYVFAPEDRADRLAEQREEAVGD